ncbi:MAG: hypothetical protein R3F22_00950 [Lysobacteraceae bacterium]
MPASNIPQPGIRPGEFIHFYTNFMLLFRRRRETAAIRAIAEAAVAHRDVAIENFESHLRELNAFFARTSGSQMAEPQLMDWPAQRIDELRAKHGGVLLAAFHFGKHREVLSDLCAQGIPFVAPIAKHSYFDAPRVFSEGPEACSNAALMLEVEDRNVGRKLAMALKRGRAGLIYVDGNMGPDGHLLEEGATDIEFLGMRIRVKTGIARLASAMQYPILPLLAVPDSGNPHQHRLLELPAILPQNEGDEDTRLSRTMQACYDALANAVESAPHLWEFAFCLHRWVQTATQQEPGMDRPTLGGELEIDPSTVIEFPRDDGVYWLHLERQRAYRLPDYTRGLYAWIVEQPRTNEALIEHLSSHASTEEIGALADELCRRDLLQAA